MLPSNWLVVKQISNNNYKKKDKKKKYRLIIDVRKCIQKCNKTKKKISYYFFKCNCAP